MHIYERRALQAEGTANENELGGFKKQEKPACLEEKEQEVG